MRRIFVFAIAACAALGLLPLQSARAWGDEGHQIIGLIAEHYLTPGVRTKVARMLAADPDTLTGHDIASASMWADKYAESDRDGSKERYTATREWHFVNVEIDNPNLDASCYGHPPLGMGQPASQGPAHDCIVDKIIQFSAELADPATRPEERLLALKFLLHFVGDLHQPLHVADNNDFGGNKKKAVAPGYPEANLHFFWDVPFVARLGSDPRRVAATLLANISGQQAIAWAHGSVTEWTFDTLALGRGHAYGMLPAPSADGIYQLTPAYLRMATNDAAMQLSKAGVRLAAVLNKALGSATTDVVQRSPR